MHGKINAKSKMFSSGIDTFQNRESHKGNFTIKIIVCSLKIILKKKHVMYTTQMSPTQLKIHGCIIPIPLHLLEVCMCAFISEE